MVKNSYQQFGTLTKFAHGLLAIVIIAMLIVGCYMGEWGIPVIGQLHKCVGLGVLLLAIFFIIWYFINERPAYPVTMPCWEQIAAKISHLSLLLAVLIMPLAGWLMSTAAGKPPQILGLALPMPGIPLSTPLRILGKETHYYVAWILVVLVSIHSLAALKHCFIDKDNILQRMWS